MCVLVLLCVFVVLMMFFMIVSRLCVIMLGVVMCGVLCNLSVCSKVVWMWLMMCVLCVLSGSCVFLKLISCVSIGWCIWCVMVLCISVCSMLLYDDSVVVWLMLLSRCVFLCLMSVVVSVLWFGKY